MANGLIREQKTEDRGQGLCAAAPRLFSRVWVFCLLSSVFCSLNAEELPDPTRPPASISAPATAMGAEAIPTGLQTIIISRKRRAAIIDGETVELGGKHGDAKLIAVYEGSVVLQGAQGRQVLTLFPDVKMTAVASTAKKGMKADQKVKTKPQAPKNKHGAVQSGEQQASQPAREEGK